MRMERHRQISSAALPSERAQSTQRNTSRRESRFLSRDAFRRDPIQTKKARRYTQRMLLLKRLNLPNQRLPPISALPMPLSRVTLSLPCSSPTSRPIISSLRYSHSIKHLRQAMSPDSRRHLLRNRRWGRALCPMSFWCPFRCIPGRGGSFQSKPRGYIRLRFLRE